MTGEWAGEHEGPWSSRERHFEVASTDGQVGSWGGFSPSLGRTSSRGDVKSYDVLTSFGYQCPRVVGGVILLCADVCTGVCLSDSIICSEAVKDCVEG
jgi:hypothetical protein